MSEEIVILGNDLTALLDTTGSTINFDKIGIGSATLRYTVRWDQAVALVAAVEVHPDFNWLVRETASITRDVAGMANVTVKFKGIEGSSEGKKDGGDHTVTNSLEGSSSSEPIETHYRFLSFAGKPDKSVPWKNGASFVEKGSDKGRFLGFAVTPDKDDPELPNTKSGVTTYLEGGFVFNEDRLYSRAEDGDINVKMNKIGEIDEPPNVEKFVDVRDGWNWILLTCNITEVGAGVKVTRKWRLSGRRGWDEDIYKDPVTP